MNSKIIESVSLLDINYEQIYFNPGCALSIYKPDAELKLLAILQQYSPKYKCTISAVIMTRTYQKAQRS